MRRPDVHTNSTTLHDTVVCNEEQHLCLIPHVWYYWLAKKTYSRHPIAMYRYSFSAGGRGGRWLGQSIKYCGAPWIVVWMPATCVWQC